MTHGDLADRIGKTPGLISHWVNATLRMPIKYAEQVAAIVGVTPATICVAYRSLHDQRRHIVSEPPAPKYLVQHPVVQRITALIAARRLSDEQLDILLTTAEALASANRKTPKRRKAASTTMAALKKA